MSKSRPCDLIQIWPFVTMPQVLHHSRHTPVPLNSFVNVIEILPWLYRWTWRKSSWAPAFCSGCIPWHVFYQQSVPLSGTRVTVSWKSALGPFRRALSEVEDRLRVTRSRNRSVSRGSSTRICLLDLVRLCACGFASAAGVAPSAVQLLVQNLWLLRFTV